MRGPHSYLAKRPEMRALLGLLVVPVDQVGLNAPGGRNEVVGKREPRSLSSESTGEVSHLDVGHPARSVVKRVSSPPIGALTVCFSAIRGGQFSALNNILGDWL